MQRSGGFDDHDRANVVGCGVLAIEARRTRQSFPEQGERHTPRGPFLRLEKRADKRFALKTPFATGQPDRSPSLLGFFHVRNRTPVTCGVRL